MKDFADLRQLLLAYRLGELSPEDREHLDEHIVSDQEFSDRIADAEYDLLDDYCGGRLARTERRRVEKAFSPGELRSSSALSLQRPGAPARPSGAVSRWLSLGIASLVLVSAGLLLLLIHLHKAQAPAPMATTRPAQDTGPQAPPIPVPTAGHDSTPSARGASHLLAVLLLQPAIARGETTSVLELAHSTQVVRVQWVVPDDVTARKFTLSVTRGGAVLKTIAQRGTLQVIGGSLAAEFDLAANVFAKSPEDARFLFILYTDDAPHSVVGEYPVIVRAQP